MRGHWNDGWKLKVNFKHPLQVQLCFIPFYVQFWGGKSVTCGGFSALWCLKFTVGYLNYWKSLLWIFCPWPMACGILVPRPGIKSALPALEKIRVLTTGLPGNVPTVGCISPLMCLCWAKWPLGLLYSYPVSLVFFETSLEMSFNQVVSSLWTFSV